MKFVRVKVRLPKDLLDEVKQLIASGWYLLVSEVFRDGVRKLMFEDMVRQKTIKS